MASDKPGESGVNGASSGGRQGPKPEPKPVSFTQLVFASFQQSQLTRMAAALAYRTMFAVVPVLVIGLSVMGNFATDQQKTELISRTLDFAGLSNIVVDEPVDEELFFTEPSKGAESGSASAEGHTASNANPSVNAGNEPTAATMSAKSPKLAEWIGGMVAKARSIPFATIGFIGLIALIYAGISFVVEVENAFNQIYRAPTGRAWFKRVIQYWFVLTLGPVALFASFYVSQTFTAWVSQLTDVAGFSEARGVMIGVAAYAATVAISWVALTFAYMSVPNTAVRLAPALMGSLVAAILWEAGKWGFTVYVSKSVSYSRLYGPLALVPLFMMWVYLTWLVVLLGLLLAHALQSYRQVRVLGLGVIGLGGQSDRPPVSPSIVDPGMALPVLVAVGTRFAAGSPSKPYQLAEALGIDEQVVVDLLGQMLAAGLVHEVGNAKGEPAYVLARPAERIEVGEALRVGFAMSDRALGKACPPSVIALREAQIALCRGRTIQDAIQGHAQPAAADPMAKNNAAAVST
jgi:membrane protein